MAIFRYEAADSNGKVLRGAMDAPSAQDVSARLSARGYRQVTVLNGGNSAVGAVSPPPSVAPRAGTVAPPLSAPISGNAPIQNPPLLGGRGAGFSLQSVPRPQDVALFFRQMGSLVHAGFTVPAALADLAPRTAHRELSNAARQMGAATASGATLAGQMVQYPALFAPHIVGLVNAGETGGFVEFAFEEAALGAEQDAALRQGLWFASFLAWQSVWSVLLTLPLIPSVNPLDLQHSLVVYLRAVFFLAVPVGIGLHILVAVLKRLRTQPAFRDQFDALSLKLPVMARLAKMRGLAAFTRVLRRLLESGISPEPAFVGAMNAVPNAVLRAQIARGVPLVRAAQGLDAAIQATGLMGHDPLQMLVTGQKTGQWIEMLDQVTAFYQEEAARATQAAKGAQKQAAVVLTIVSSGYVLIIAASGMSHMFGWVDQFMETDK